MKAIRPWSLIAALVVAAGVAWWQWPQWRSSGPRPGILLVTVDTLRADRVGAYGGRTVKTPALDRLAESGRRFAAAYAVAPLTLPSHVSMLSGRLPVEHGVRTNDGYRVPEATPLVADTLRRAGFRTAAFVGSTVVRGATGLARGFEQYDDRMGGAPERRAELVVGRATQWLATVGDAPFFVWIHLYDPHLPYAAPEAFASAHPKQPYDAEVAYVDHVVGQLLDALDRARLGERTSVIAVADHGEGLGEHGERSHGALLYDSTLRVPLIVRAAGESRRRVVDTPVSTAQIAPTLLKLAGLRAETVLPDLLTEVPATDAVTAETLYLAQQLGWSPIYAARIGRWKVIDAPVPELYDVETDPWELRNLASGDAATLARLRQVLRRDLEAAAKHAVRPVAASADPETTRQLAALGYVSGGGALASGAPAAEGRNPITNVAVWEQVERGLELANSERRDEARAAFEATLRSDPSNVLALKFLGADALERGDLSRAIALNERVVATGLHRADALSNLSLAHYRAGSLEPAVARGREAVGFDSSHAAARRNLALALLALGTTHARDGKTSAAIEALNEAATLDPANLDVLERLGAALHRAGRADDARARFTAVLAADGNRPLAHMGIAMIDLEAGRPREAAARLERLASGWPGAYQAQFYLGEAYHRLGDTARARAAYAASIAAAPPGDQVTNAARRALATLR
jgi:arylsulfatase A-like enzyme/Flp pilus assembly protein TadD